MTTLDDVTRTAEAYGADQLAAVQPQIDDLTAQVQLRTAERDAAFKRIAELEPKPPVTRLPFGIGINEKVMSSKLPLAYTRAKLEQLAGVRFAYIREYSTWPATGMDTSLVSFADSVLSRGSVPILSSKLPSNDWDGAANGKYDAAIDATEDALQALVGKYRDKGFTRARVIRSPHHEFDNGDGPLAAFNAMIEHLLPIMRRPGDLEFWLDFTGYAQLFTPTKTAFTFDAVWHAGVDGYAIDPYQSTFQQKANANKATFTDLPASYFQPFADWCDSKGIQKGVWETGYTAPAQQSPKPEAKVWVGHNADGAADLGFTMWCYWNNNNPNSGNDWRIQDLAPAMTKEQMLVAMRKHGWA